MWTWCGKLDWEFLFFTENQQPKIMLNHVIVEPISAHGSVTYFAICRRLFLLRVAWFSFIRVDCWAVVKVHLVYVERAIIYIPFDLSLIHVGCLSAWLCKSAKNSHQ